MAEIMLNKPINKADPSPNSTNVARERHERNYLTFVIPMFEEERQDILADPHTSRVGSALCSKTENGTTSTTINHCSLSFRDSRE
jgi:hypothetical protein